VRNGYKSLEYTDLAEGKQRQLRTGKPEYAHEACLFNKHCDRFEALNELVRGSVVQSLGVRSASAGCIIKDRALKGVTLGQFRALTRDVKQRCEKQSILGQLCTLAQDVKHRCKEQGVSPSISSADKVPKQLWPNVTSRNVVELFIKPATKERNCSYVELLATGPQPPEIFVTHGWDASFADLAAAIDWLADARQLGDDAVIFLDIACINLNNKVQDQCDEESLAKGAVSTHRLCMQECQGQFVVEGLGRGWVIWELLHFLNDNKRVDLGCAAGVLACTQSFSDGSGEFGAFKPSLARQLCCVRIQDLQTSLGEREHILNGIAALCPSLAEAEAFCRLEQRMLCLAAGPVLRAAALNDDAHTIRKVCRCPGLSLNSETLRGGLGETAVHVAAAAEKLEALRTLLMLSSNPNAQDSVRETPLHWAALTGSCSALRVLLRSGADPTLESAFAETPMDVALQSPAAFLGIETKEAVDILQAAESLSRMLLEDYHLQ